MTSQEQTEIDLSARLDALQVAVTALEKQIGRAGREQLKANALSETQAEHLAAAMDALRTAQERQEAAAAAERQQSQVAMAEARLAVVRSIFPTLDGLDDAIRAGRATLDHASRREPAEVLLQRLLLDEVAAPDEDDPLYAALSAWLAGLDMVRRRLLDALAAEGVTPMVVASRPFDPHHHIAVEIVATDARPGTILYEIRRGFLAGTRVLRHAEVAVAGEPQQKERPT